MRTSLSRSALLALCLALVFANSASLAGIIAGVVVRVEGTNTETGATVGRDFFAQVNSDDTFALENETFGDDQSM